MFGLKLWSGPASVIDTSDTTCQRSFGKPLDFKHPHSLSQPLSFTESTSHHLSTFINLHQPPTLSTNYTWRTNLPTVSLPFPVFFPFGFPYNTLLVSYKRIRLSPNPPAFPKTTPNSPPTDPTSTPNLLTHHAGIEFDQLQKALGRGIRETPGRCRFGCRWMEVCCLGKNGRWVEWKAVFSSCLVLFFVVGKDYYVFKILGIRN